VANEIEIVVTSKDKSGPGFKSSQKAAEEYAGGLDKAGEHADNAETKLIGLHDVVDGTAAIMQGPGKAGITAYIQGWADLAGGLAPLLPALKALTLSTIRETAASVASTAAQKTAAAASKSWAVAQAGLNAVMDANPIALTVIAIAALVAIVIVAYKHSERFRAAVNLLWSGLKTGAREAVSAVIGLISGLLGAFSAVLRALGHLPGPMGKPFRAAADAIDRARGKLRGFQDDLNRTPTHKTITVDTIFRSFGTPGGGRRLGVGMQAHGGIVGAEGGGPRSRLTMVGEHGAELLDLPPGTRVRSNPDTERLLAGAGAGGRLVEVHLDLDGKTVAKVLIDPLRGLVRQISGGDVQAALGR
jgi:hypothetical protein